MLRKSSLSHIVFENMTVISVWAQSMEAIRFLFVQHYVMMKDTVSNFNFDYMCFIIPTMQ